MCEWATPVNLREQPSMGIHCTYKKESKSDVELVNMWEIKNTICDGSLSMLENRLLPLK